MFSSVLRFELTALRQLGHLPSLTACAGCGGQAPPTAGRIPFGVLAGGVLCRQCRSGQRQVIGLRLETLNLLREYSSVQEPADLLPKEGRGELRGLLNQFFANLLGRRPRMHPYLGEW